MNLCEIGILSNGVHIIVRHWKVVVLVSYTIILIGCGCYVLGFPSSQISYSSHSFNIFKSILEQEDNEKPLEDKNRKDFISTRQKLETNAHFSNNDGLDRISEKQRAIQSTVMATCKSYPRLTSIDASGQGQYFPCNQFYYCGVAKLGTTFFTAFFNKTFECTRRRTKYKNVKNVFAFMNSGDPYERLFSAYVNKLYQPQGKFWGTVGKDIVQNVRKSSKMDDGSDVTFNEFLQYIVLYHESGKILNRHFQPIHKKCNPCQIHFDFISRKETLSTDIVELFKSLKINGNIKGEIAVTEIEDSTRNVQDEHMPSLNSTLIAISEYPNMSPYKLFIRFWSTYQIRGKILNQFEMPFTESEAEDMTIQRFVDLIATAVDSSKVSQEQLKLQRREALLKAYESVSLDLLLRLSDFVKMDCLLFGYDVKPAKFFNRDALNGPTTHFYFKGL